MFGNLNAITKGKIRICGWWLIENGAINFGYTGPYCCSDPNYAKAVEYFTLAAESGLPHAVFGLGECYYAGKGVEKDLEKAAECYRQALEEGYELVDPTEQEHVKELLGEDVK